VVAFEHLGSEVLSWDMGLILCSSSMCGKTEANT
jgi:hypothetical protein